MLAAGIVVGSASWGIAAALGMSAAMAANVWVLEIVRYLGAAYLLYLAIKSLRRAWQGSPPPALKSAPRGKLFLKGLLLHLTNPKAILGWGAIYAIALPLDAPMAQVWVLFAMLICVSQLVFFGYAVLFSIPHISAAYRAAGRWFDTAFGLLFGAASLKILTTRLV